MVPDEDFGAVCPNCKQIFYFTSVEMGYSKTEGVPTGKRYRYGLNGYTPKGDPIPYDIVTYPHNNLLKVAATCGHCNHRQVYDYDSLILPEKAARFRNETKRTERLSEEITRLKSEKTKLEGQLEEAYKTIKQKDADISKLAEAYFQLGKRLSQQPQSSEPQTEKVSYEGPKT
jgi:uncharacterized protein YdcH (DUF465 family)